MACGLCVQCSDFQHHCRDNWLSLSKHVTKWHWCYTDLELPSYLFLSVSCHIYWLFNCKTPTWQKRPMWHFSPLQGFIAIYCTVWYLQLNRWHYSPHQIPTCHEKRVLQGSAKSWGFSWDAPVFFQRQNLSGMVKISDFQKMKINNSG